MNQFMPLAALAGVYFISQTLWLFWALYRDMRHLDNKEIIDGWREAVSIRDKEIDNFSQVNQRLQQECLSYKKSFESRKEQCEQLEEIIKTGKSANAKQADEIWQLREENGKIKDYNSKLSFEVTSLTETLKCYRAENDKLKAKKRKAK